MTTWRPGPSGARRWTSGWPPAGTSRQARHAPHGRALGSSARAQQTGGEVERPASSCRRPPARRAGRRPGGPAADHRPDRGERGRDGPASGRRPSRVGSGGAAWSSSAASSRRFGAVGVGRRGGVAARIGGRRRRRRRRPRPRSRASSGAWAAASASAVAVVLRVVRRLGAAASSPPRRPWPSSAAASRSTPSSSGASARRFGRRLGARHSAGLARAPRSIVDRCRAGDGLGRPARRRGRPSGRPGPEASPRARAGPRSTARSSPDGRRARLAWAIARG